MQFSYHSKEDAFSTRATRPPPPPAAGTGRGGNNPSSTRDGVMNACIDVVAQIQAREQAGDVLVFMTGQVLLFRRLVEQLITSVHVHCTYRTRLSARCLPF